jgi:hypothetical protein
MILLMKRKSRKQYASPTTDYIELKAENVLCGSLNALFTTTLFWDNKINTPFDGGGEDW